MEAVDIVFWHSISLIPLCLPPQIDIVLILFSAVLYNIPTNLGKPQQIAPSQECPLRSSKALLMGLSSLSNPPAGFQRPSIIESLCTNFSQPSSQRGLQLWQDKPI